MCSRDQEARETELLGLYSGSGGGVMDQSNNTVAVNDETLYYGGGGGGQHENEIVDYEDPIQPTTIQSGCREGGGNDTTTSDDIVKLRNSDSGGGGGMVIDNDTNLGDDGGGGSQKGILTELVVDSNSVDEDGEDEDIDRRSVYVGNVDYGSTPHELQDHFKTCGAINRITIMVDKFTGHPKGFAYIEFADAEAVSNAVVLTDTLFRGRTIKVNPKRHNIPGYGRGRGRGFPRGARGRGRGGFGRGFRGRGMPFYGPRPRGRGMKWGPY